MRHILQCPERALGKSRVRVNGKPIDSPTGKRTAVWKISPIVSRGRRGIEVFGSF